MTTIEEFQNVIDENNILIPKHFKERFEDIYNEMKRLGLHTRVRYLKSRKLGLVDSTNTVEEFQRFIDENDIERPVQFKTQFSGLYRKLTREGYALLLNYPDKRYICPPDEFNTVEDFQKFIDENNVQNPTDFMLRFPRQYNRSCKLKLNTKIFYPNKKVHYTKYFAKDYNIVDDFQNFINEQNLSGGGEFSAKFHRIHQKFVTLGFQPYVVYPNAKMPDIHINQMLYGNYGLKEIQEYINNNDIKSPAQLQKKNKYLYSRIKTLELMDKIPWKHKVVRKDLGHLNTIEDFQSYIDSNGVESYYQFMYDHRKEYRKYIGLELRKTDKPLKFPDDEIIDSKGFVFRSTWEQELAKILTENGIEYKREYSFKKLRGKGDKSRPARFDFYLPQYNILIEIQGPRHFFPIHERIEKDLTENVKTYLNQRYMDLKKHRYIQEHEDCKILYYAHGKDGKYLVEHYGYPYYIYTNIKLLLEDIKKNKK